MAGTQRYTSSLFVQSGSVAQFKSGITSSEVNIAGVVYANQYLDLDGNPVSSGGTQAVFFAGTGSGISQSNPVSQDHFFAIQGDLSVSNPNDVNAQPIIAPGTVRIETTSSLDFTPNFYNFMKIGNDSEDLITVQQGTNPTYIVDDTTTQINELKAGTHRYIIYAADTNPGGSTHQVYHTVTLTAFVNEAPELIIPTGSIIGSPVTMSLDHDSNSKDLILHFTNSTDPNQEQGELDFIKIFSASRQTSDPTTDSTTDTSDGYTLNLLHTTTTEFNNSEGDPTIATQSLTPGLAEAHSPGALHFTASLTNYNAFNGNQNTIEYSLPQEERFTIEIQDDYPTAEIPGITKASVSMSVVPPPTSSISNIKILFSGTDNSNGNNNTLNDNHTHTVLYDRTQSLDSTEIANLNSRYHPSIVKLKLSASITEPPNFIVIPEDHTTRIKIVSSSDGNFNFNNGFLGNFLFSGSSTNETVTASHFNDTIADLEDGPYSPLEANHFLVLTEKIDKTSRDIYFGADNSTKANLNKSYNIRHGNHDHFEAFTFTPTNKLTLNPCPEIKIDNIVVEVESGSFATNEGTSSLTSSLLYNLTSSLSSSQTASFFSSFTPGQEPYNQYVSQSIVRLRIKCKITEPFGPDHNGITASFNVSGDNTGATTTTTTTTVEKFSISPADGFGDLGAPNSNAVNTTLNLTSLLNSTLDITDSDYSNVTLKVEKIEIRGDLGSGQTTEYIENFMLGSDDEQFGDNVQLISGLSNLSNNNITNTDVTNNAAFESITETPAIFGQSATFITYGHNGLGDWPVFITVWSGSNGGNRPVTLNSNGTIDISFDPGDDVSYKAQATDTNDYYQFKITFEATKTFTTINTDATSPEVTTFENLEFIFHTGSEYAVNPEHTTNHDYTEFSGKELLVSEYTSSWAEFIQKEGTTQFSAIFTSESNAGSILDTATSQSAEVSMSGVPSVRIDDLIYEIEEYGYSGDAATETTVRTVLYGDAHITNNGTGSGESGESWATHETASIYASHSVSRVRVRGTFTEPVGPSAGTLSIGLNHSEAPNTSFKDINIPINLNSPTNNAPESGNDISSSITNLVDGQLVTTFTSSWIGTQLTLPSDDRAEGDEHTFTISGSATYTHDSNYEGSNNGIIISTPTTNNITVKQTPATVIESVEVVSETHGYSGIETKDTVRTVLYGDNRVTNNGTGSNATGESWADHTLSIPYASQSVSRFKLKVSVQEPLGPLHYGNATYAIRKQKDGGGIQGGVYNLGFNTESADLNYFEFKDYKLFATYTSSFRGITLAANNGTTVNNEVFSYILHSPSNELSINSNYTDLGERTDVSVIDTPPAEIRDLIVESETVGYSSIPTTDSNTFTVLYGQTTTNTGTGSGETGEFWATHPLAEKFVTASISRFRYRFKVVEPIGPLHHETSVTPEMVNGASISSPLSLDIFNTNSIEVTDEAYFDPNGTSADSNKLIYTVTSSFSGSNLDSDSRFGENYIYRIISTDISHIALNENNNTYTATNGTYNFIVKDTPQTTITEVFYETETFGYSSAITQNATRSILYGDNHQTNDGTGSGESGVSWANHDLAVTYASHSVSRVRVRAKVTEPLGPLHHETDFIRKFIRSSNSLITNLSTLTFSTNSLGSISGNTELDSNNRRITRYTSSFEGVQLTSNLQNGDTYTFDGSQEHNPSVEDNLSVTLQPAAQSKILVKDTPDTQIIIGDVDIETFGESGIAASNHESSTSIPDTHTRVILLGEPNTRPTGSEFNSFFTGSAVLRTHIKAFIIEPLGPLHHAASMSVLYDAADGSSNDKLGPLINFSTESGDILNRSFGYDLEGRLTSSYTSSFTGSSIPPQSHYQLRVLDSNITFAPPTEGSDRFTRTDSGFTNFIKVEQGADHEIDNFFIEVENLNSGSNVGNKTSRNTHVLHGNTGSETNHSVNSGYPQEDDREQLVSVRILASILNPPSIDHHAANMSIKRFLASSNLIFIPTTDTVKTLKLTTGSSNSDVFSFNNPPIEETSLGVKIHYTSSFFPILFNAQGNTKTGSIENISTAYSDAIFGESVNNSGRLGTTSSFIAGLITGTDASDPKHNNVLTSFTYGPRGSEDGTISENEAFTRYSPTNAELRSHTAIPANFRDEDSGLTNALQFGFDKYKNPIIEELKFEVGEGATYSNISDDARLYTNPPQGNRPTNTPRTPGGASLGEWTFQVQNTSHRINNMTGDRFGMGIGTFDGEGTLWSTIYGVNEIESTLVDRTSILLEFGITQAEIDDIESNHKYTIPNNNSVNALSEDHPLYILSTIPSYNRDNYGFDVGNVVYHITDPLIAFLLQFGKKFTDPHTDETIYYVGYNQNEPGLIDSNNASADNFGGIPLPTVVGYNGNTDVNNLLPTINSNFPWGKSYWDYGTGPDLRTNFDNPNYKPIATASYGLFRGKNEILDNSFHFKKHNFPLFNFTNGSWMGGFSPYPNKVGRMTSGSINLSQSLRYPNNPRIKISNIKLQGDFNQTYHVTDNGNTHKNIQLYPYNSSIELFLGNKGALQLNEEISTNKWFNEKFNTSLRPSNTFKNSALLKEESNYISHSLDTEGNLLGTSIMIIPGKKPRNINNESENTHKPDATTFYEAGHPVFNYPQQLLDLNVNNDISFENNGPSHVEIQNGFYSNLDITDEYFNVQTSSIDYNSLIIPLNKGTMQFGFKRSAGDRIVSEPQEYYYKPFRKDIREDGNLAAAGNNHSTSNKEYGYGMYSSNNENESTRAKVYRQGQGEYSWGMKMSFEELAPDLFYNEDTDDEENTYRPFTMAVYGGGYIDDPENAINGKSDNYGVFRAGREGTNFDGVAIKPKTTHDGTHYNLEIKIDMGIKLENDSIIGDLIIRADKDYIQYAKLYASNAVQDPTTTVNPMTLSSNINVTSQTNQTLTYNDGSTLLTEYEYKFTFNDWKDIGFNELYRYYTLIIPLGTDETRIYDIDLTTISSIANFSNHEKARYKVSASLDNIISDTATEEVIFTPSSVTQTLNDIDIFTSGAISSSITFNFGTGSLISSSFFNSSDSEESLYFIYPENGGNYQEIQVFPENITTIPPTFTSESNLTFPNNLNITASSNNVNFSFANDGSNPLINDPTSGTASIFIYNPSNYSNVVNSSNITLIVKDQETGSGFFQVSQSIFVIPKAPQTMSGDFDMVIDAHPTEMEDKFYFGLLASESLVNYSGSDADKPKNPTSIVSSSRILFASTSAGYNYSMSLFTHTNDSPSYSTHATNEAFNFGDSGSLELKINGTTKTQVSLQSNFDSSNKDTTQTLSGYDNNYSSYTFNNGTASFTEGKLFITKVAPFNTVSQSISKEGYLLNNGYQGFGVKIELDDRIRAGYNYLELIHNIADGFTQSMNVFDWYYNDGIEIPSIKPNENLSYTEISNTPATHSLSGVSYFRDQTSFTASIDQIYNLANKVYNHGPNNTFKNLINTLITHDEELVVKTDSAIMSNVSSPTAITHKVDPNLSDSRKGLRFHEGDNHFIPTAQSTASIKYELSTTLPTNVDPIQGKSYNFNLRFNNRVKTSEHNYTLGGANDLKTGRFMKSGSDLNSLTTVNYVSPNIPSMTASFFDEDRRWSRTSLLDSQSNNPNTMDGNDHDYTFWVSSSRANYDSVQNISSTNNLQQLYTGKLIFPSESYDGTLPNTVDYSTVTENEQREYYTAISASTLLSIKNFTMIVKGNINKTDFPAGVSGQDATDGHINIFAKIPGPVNVNSQGNNNDFPGTGFGSITGQQGLQSNIKLDNVTFRGNFNDNETTDGSIIAFDFTLIGCSINRSDNIFLVKVTMSGSIDPSKYIEQITIKSRS